MRGLIIRICKQMKNDKRSLAMMFIIPLVIITFLYFLLGEGSVDMQVYLSGANESISDIFSKSCTLIEAEDDQTVEDILKGGKADVCIEFNADNTIVYFLEDNSTYRSEINEIMQEVQTEVLNQKLIVTEYVYGKELKTTFEKLIYVLLGVISFFLVFLLAGVSFVRERTVGTLERLMLTPVKRSKVVLGYTFGFGIFGGLQSIVILLFVHYILGITFQGSVFYAMLIMILLAFSAVSIGAFVSIFASSEFQVVQFVPIVIIPQIFYSGLLPLDTLPFNLDKLAYIMPIYYGCSGLKKILINGEAFDSIVLCICMLVIQLFVFYIVNLLSLKKYRAL